VVVPGVGVFSRRIVAYGWEMRKRPGGPSRRLRVYPYPDVILLDIRMPGILDGLQTLKAIRADSRHSSLSVMILTSSEHDLDVNRGPSYWKLRRQRFVGPRHCIATISFPVRIDSQFLLPKYNRCLNGILP